MLHDYNSWTFTAKTDSVLMKPTLTEPILPRLYRVQQSKQETYDTWTLEFEPVDGHDGFSFAPGQFNMVYEFGVGEVPISISGDPANPKKLIHTIRSVGAATKALCSLKKSDEVTIRGPYGTHWPVEDSIGHDVVIVAGGVGLPPLRPAIYHLLSNREQYGRILLLYGARTPQDMLYTAELKQWRARFDVDVETTVDTARPEWHGNVGVVTTLIPRANFDPQRAKVFIVGPEIMTRFTIIELQKRGVTAEGIFVSLERNMKCGIGHCGHCQLGSKFVCRDGPIFRYDQVQQFLSKREI
jgi:NAD(P)H-flavin reductase